ncbi:MAG: 50S ribosomal protein L31 [Gammaproteobacteria bacterium]|nr:50S ribosomal protein L31 [Phycisphaerae bacterium]NIX16722.1 50S ribosomal protein L31 [Gammaproteobacteria bacterium]
MKKEIHPKYYPNAKVICACGNTWTTGSTKEEIHTDVCFQCHPFFTGEQRIVDTEGQVDRFYKKLQARQEYLDDKAAKEAEKVSPERPIEELDLGTRAVNALENVGITNVGHALERLAEGEEAMLEIDGFGRKSLADLKKRLRQFGYEIPEAAEEIAV